MTRAKVDPEVRRGKIAAGKRLLAFANGRGMTLVELSNLTGTGLAALRRWADGGMPLASVSALEHARQVLKVGGIMPRLGRAAKSDRVLTALAGAAPRTEPVQALPPAEDKHAHVPAKPATGDLGDAAAAVALLIEAIPTPMLWAELAKRNGGAQ